MQRALTIAVWMMTAGLVILAALLWAENDDTPLFPGALLQCSDDAYEENDSEATAKSISLGSAQIHLHCDEDWVYYQTAPGATYQIDTYNLTGGADTVLSLYLSGDGLVATDDNGGGGLASRLTWTNTIDGYHWVRVTEADTYQSGEGYSLLVDCIANCPCIDDSYEEDDSLGTAGAIIPNSGSAQVHYHCDEDWVTYQGELGATYRIETSNLAGGADTVLELHGSGGFLTTDNDSGTGLASLITWTASQKYFWVRVTDFASDYGYGKSYHLQVDCTADCPCADDSFEPDDLRAEASTITVDGGPRTLLHCDEDWLTFPATTGVTYTIETSNLVGDADTVLELYTAAGLTATDDNGGTDLASLLQWTATANDWVDIRVRESADDYLNGKGYDIEVSCTLDCSLLDIFSDGFESGNLNAWSGSTGS